jgi:hypothetical protein
VVAAATTNVRREIPKQYFVKKGRGNAARTSDKVVPTSKTMQRQANISGTSGAVPVSLDSKRSGREYSREVEFDASSSDGDEDEDEGEDGKIGGGGEVGHVPCKDWAEESDREGTGVGNGFDSTDDEDDKVEEIVEKGWIEGGSRFVTRYPEAPNVGGDAWAGDVTSEKCLMAEVGNLFRRKKFFGGDGELESDSPVAHFFYDKLKIAESNRKGWWKEVQWKIRKKIDAKRSSCASAIKIEFMRKYCWTCLLL